MSHFLLLLLFLLTFGQGDDALARAPIKGVQNATTRNLPPVNLPDDEGTHKYKVEWWYYTGHLETVETDSDSNSDSNSVSNTDVTTGVSRKFAFEMCVFRGVPLKPFSGYVAHFALIDLDNKKHTPYQRINPFASLRSPAPSSNGFKFIFDSGKWLVEGYNGNDRLKARTSHHGIDLELTSLKSAALYGDQGILDYGISGKMAYYSRTRMQTNGFVTAPDENGDVQKYRVTGATWMDHQWGESQNPESLGWNWFGIQLSNGDDLIFFHAKKPETGEITKRFGTIISKTGETIVIPDDLVEIDSYNPWSFENVSYPMEFNIRVTVPFNINLHTKARFPEQRFEVPFPNPSVTPIYWEGSSSTEGLLFGDPVTGQGFTEMAGYE